MMQTGYDPSLVALSIAIAVLASYTALDLGGRVRGAAPGARWGWIGAASLAMGGGNDGWSVTEAVDGRAALARARERRPDVVLLDLNMPVMDGFDFLAELRSLPGCAEVPVVVLTARDLTNDDRRRLRGANQVLNKGDIGMRGLVERLHGLADHPKVTA